METVSPIRFEPASGPGALDGYAAQCSCGLEIKSSLLSLAQFDAQAHVEWHLRRQLDRSARTAGWLA